MAKYADIQTWVQAQPKYVPEAKAEFARVSDGWLVAFALAKDYEVVTNEVHEPNKRNRVKIPSVCMAFNVHYANTFDMLRELGVRFILA